MNNIEISGVCRCCLSQPINLNDLFKSTDNINIVDAIQEVCGIMIYPDSCLPDQICDECLECLTSSYTFRIRTQQSDKTLQSILDGSIIAKEYIADTDQIDVSNHTDFTTTEPDSQSDEETNDNPDKELTILFDIGTTSTDGLQCSHCKKEFIHLKNLRVHMRRHFTEGRLSCSHCPNKYHTKFDLHRHMTKIHFDGIFVKCDLCDKEFPTKPELNRHIRTHDEKKPYSCPECGMQFKMKHNAQQHINSHRKKNPFVCETCGKGFAFACKLKNHNKSNCRPSVYISVQKEDEEL